MKGFIKTKLGKASVVEKGSIFIGLLIFLGTAAISSIGKKDLRQDYQLITRKTVDTPLYLPEARYVKLVSFGFNYFASDVLWFQTINYFGKHYEGDKDYRWLYHMCDLVTELDGKKKYAYEFCGTLLSWEAKDAESSNRILSKAIEQLPEEWRYQYLRGFNHWYFLENRELAKEDLQRAAKLPGAPPFVASIASRLIGDKDSLDTAIMFLKDLIDNTNDEHAKKSLKNKLKRAKLSKYLNYLQEKVDQFEMKYQRKLTDLNELVSSGFIEEIPKEPFKGSFLLDEETHRVVTSSGRKGLDFKGLTAKTSALKNEFQ